MKIVGYVDICLICNVLRCLVGFAFQRLIKCSAVSCSLYTEKMNQEHQCINGMKLFFVILRLKLDVGTFKS